MKDIKDLPDGFRFDEFVEHVAKVVPHERRIDKSDLQVILERSGLVGVSIAHNPDRSLVRIVGACPNDFLAILTIPKWLTLPRRLAMEKETVRCVDQLLER